MGVCVGCTQVVFNGLNVCLYGVVDPVWGPVWISFGGEALVGRGFCIAKVSS